MSLGNYAGLLQAVGGVRADTDDMYNAATEQVVQHVDEPAVRDEELARLQADHDWADALVQMITDPVLTNSFGDGLECLGAALGLPMRMEF